MNSILQDIISELRERKSELQDENTKNTPENVRKKVWFVRQNAIPFFYSTEETSFHNSDVLKHMINNQFLDL